MTRSSRDNGRPPAVNWRAIYDENLPRIYNYLRFRVGDDLIAEDLTSATFEKAWRNRHRFDEKLAEFSTWLFAIASNLAIDHYRKLDREIELRYLDRDAHAQSAEEAAEKQARYAQLLSLLEALPPRERDLFAMKHGAELTNRQIAELTGLSETNVGTILHRVVKHLRAELEGER